MESSASGEEITRTLAEFGRRIEQQASAVLQTSSVMEEMMASIKNIAGLSAAEREKAEELSALTESGAANVAATFDGLNSISRRLETVHEVIEVIDEIASRTNLLAMNAAIEAAHAGDSGKGFAVVADEIRRLAESTTENSATITENLGRIISDIADTESAGRRSMESLELIKTRSRTLSDSLGSIGRGTAEMAAGSAEIGTSLSELVEITETTRAGAGEMTRGTEEILQAIAQSRDSLASSAEHASRIASRSVDINQAFFSLAESMVDLGKASGALEAAARRGGGSGPNLPVLALQHLLWVLRMRLMLDGRITLDAAAAGDHRSCDLGKWLLSEAAAPWRGRAGFRGFEHMHEEFHGQVRALLSEWGRAPRALSEERYAALMEHSRKVLEAMAKLGG